MKNILFVCTGNTCRSPMAAAVMKQMLPFQNTDSAGLASNGEPYCQKSVAVLSEIGISLSGFSKQATPELIKTADMIFCMSHRHKEMLVLLGAKEEKITVLDIPDPYGGDIAVYRACRDSIIRALAGYDISVRTANENDFDALANLERVTFNHPWSKDALAESFENGTTFFVAQNKLGKIIGYMGLTVILDEGYVTNIAVLPEYQGLGTGKAILDTAIEFAKEKHLSFITLEVRKSNENAIKLYKSRNFAEKGIRKGFYADPNEDAFIFTRMMNNENLGD